MKKLLMSFLLVGIMACSPKSEEQSNIEVSVPVENQVIEQSQSSEDISDWVLKTADIIFTSKKTDIKGNDILETGYFKNYSGFFDKQGELSLKIDLSSVDTDITIRDQRLKDWLFDVDDFENATVTTKLNADAINQLKINESIQLKQPIELQLHGHKLELMTDLLITRESSTLIVAKTIEPIQLDIMKFDMGDGLNKLKEVMGLSKIDSVVPVTFKGEFVRPV